MTAVRLMVVDDHEVLREGLRFMLQRSPDVDVIAEASGGEEALAMLEEDRPDVMLLDLNMPGMDGLTTLRVMQERWPEVAVLVLSFYDDPEYVEQALRSGASGYLLKTVSRDELIRAVKAAAAGAGYLQAEITRPVLQKFAASSEPAGEFSLSPVRARSCNSSPTACPRSRPRSNSGSPSRPSRRTCGSSSTSWAPPTGLMP